MARIDPTSVIIEADGGSRGNPGPAGYGAVLKDAATGAVIAEDGAKIGVATNNVAEYSGLIAGLKLAAEFAPDADIEVRMDSKLVVEQMSGRWKIKHPDMKPLAATANGLAPFGTTYTWVPREKNKHADRLANEALDGKRSGVTASGELPAGPPVAAAKIADTTPREQDAGYRGWSSAGAEPTTLVLVRHGETPLTREKRFSGGLGGSNPGLTDEGRAQVRAAADWLSALGERAAVVVASPVRRARESAEIVASRLGLPMVEEPRFAEMEFGAWDGLTFAEVSRRHPDDLTAWLDSLDVAAGGGESFRKVRTRVLAGLERLLTDYAGQTVVVVSHVTPIKTLVAEAIGADLESLYRMELTSASVSVVAFWPPDDDGRRPATLRLFNASPIPLGG